MTETIADAWSTNNQVTIFLIENIPDDIWEKRIPGYQQKTIRMVGAHLHNCRGMWIKGVGRRFGVAPPESVDRHQVTRPELANALKDSGRLIKVLLEASLEGDGRMPGFTPSEVYHFAAYLIAHEGHHRGQITMAARQLGNPIDKEVMYGMWQWGKRRDRDSRTRTSGGRF